MIQSPYVSIVSGTYNRLKSLKRMVESVRSSIGIGIPYEIILVDGGSFDGTIQYLKQQSDVVLIEQKELLGAVKAFKAGFDVAKGKYVVIANDDIQFRYESLMNSVAVMDDNPLIGIGCFPQNRYNEDYTVAKMHAVIDGRQTNTWYGQVCIIPKWLGDKVGWWDPGVGYHTYAGDNELTCNVLELGLKVVPLDSCCINDFIEEDHLRSINKQGTKRNEVHPDSALWVKKWTRDGLIGPKVSNFPLIEVKDRRVQRCLYAPIYEEDQFPLQLKTKKGLRESLSKKYLTTEINFRKDPELLYYAISMFLPDVAVIQFHNPAHVSYDLMMKIKDEFPKTKLVSWNGDYNQTMLKSKGYKQVAKLFDLATFVSLDIAAEYEREGINYKYWQIGYEEYEPVKYVESEKIDVLFMGNCYTQDRQALGEMIRFHKEWNSKFYGKWPSHIGSDGITQYDFVTGDSLYRSSKISVGVNTFPTSYGYVSNRIFQALHSGNFTLQQEIPGMTETIGLEDGVHLVVWKDLKDLEDKIKYWLPRRSEREQIAREGKMFVDKWHTFDQRVNELEKMLAGLKS